MLLLFEQFKMPSNAAASVAPMTRHGLFREADTASRLASICFKDREIARSHGETRKGYGSDCWPL